MSKWLLLFALAAATIPAPAAQRVTVAELRQFLTEAHAARKSDGSIAGHLGKLELSEQLRGPTLDQIAADIKPGEKTEQALQLLADESAFLLPPASEIPDKPAPQMSEQIRLLQGAANFASVTLENLPDFLATRTTHSFENSALYMTPDGLRSGFVGGGDLHATGEYSRQVTYRDGAEVVMNEITPEGQKEKPYKGVTGLTSSGEFGPLLQMVLRESVMSNGLSWSHWEKTRSGLAAVFRVDVPESVSLYIVNFCCVLFSSRSAGAGNKEYEGNGRLRTFHAPRGYHGFLYLDSETGIVMRVTVEPDLRSTDPVARASDWVEYGTVTIGERSYICPVRSMAIMVFRDGPQKEPGLIHLNEVTFTDYHRFGTTTRILPAADGP